MPLHPELAAEARSAPGRREHPQVAAVRCQTSRSTGWRWLNQALGRAVGLGAISSGRKVGTHTLRHSAARHWLNSGVPINHVSKWLGHASLQSTLIYLEILPDPTGYMDRAM